MMTVEDYISGYEGDIMKRLVALRELSLKVAPQAQEKIAYGMPAYSVNGPLFYFGVAKKHIGFYPTNEGVAYFHEHFPEESKQYASSKGAIQFKHSEPIPYDLIERIMIHRLSLNMASSRK